MMLYEPKSQSTPFPAYVAKNESGSSLVLVRLGAKVVYTVARGIKKMA